VTSPPSAFKVDRDGGERLSFAGAELVVRASADTTGGAFSMRRVVPRTGRVLVLCSPAGFEGFFRELDEAERDGSIGPAAYASVSEKYGITWLDR
jgi:hypothetical protein